MANKKQKPSNTKGVDVDENDFSEDLIKALNVEFGERIAYNLGTSESPTHVKRWLSTGCTLLDYAMANKAGGGVPEGRIIEISGEPSTGKSHIALAIAANVQKMGGLVVLIDTENATPVPKLADMGIDVTNRFVYVDTHETESVFKIMESVIAKTALVNKKKNLPILVIWDSVAATSPKAELEGDYDTSTMGLQARVISKAMRKITGVIGQNNITFLCLNQVRSKIGVMFGDPTVTPGGKAIPFHASIRVGLTGGSAVKDKEGNVIGIHTYATIKKNKVAPPHRKVEFDILFGRGISEYETVFDLLREKSEKNPAIIDGVTYQISGAGAWKNLTVKGKDDEVIIDHKFYKADFDLMMKDPKFKPFIDKMIDHYMVINTSYDQSNGVGHIDESDVVGEESLGDE